MDCGVTKHCHLHGSYWKEIFLVLLEAPVRRILFFMIPTRLKQITRCGLSMHLPNYLSYAVVGTVSYILTQRPRGCVQLCWLPAGLSHKDALPAKKMETTMAPHPCAKLRRESCALASAPLLDHAWLAKWERSQARYPYGLAEDLVGQFEMQVRSHAQFTLSNL